MSRTIPFKTDIYSYKQELFFNYATAAQSWVVLLMKIYQVKLFTLIKKKKLHIEV